MQAPFVLRLARAAARAVGCIRQHTSAYVSIRQHTSAYVSIRQITSAYVSIRHRALREGAAFVLRLARAAARAVGCLQ